MAQACSIFGANSTGVGDTVQRTVDLSANESCIVLNEDLLDGFINAGGGNPPFCNLYLLDTGACSADTLFSLANDVSRVRICCDITTCDSIADSLLLPSGIYEIYADDDGTDDTSATAGPMYLDIQVITRPVIVTDTICDTFLVATDSIYALEEDAGLVNNGYGDSLDCAVPFGSIQSPTFLDVCGLDSLAVCFIAGDGVSQAPMNIGFDLTGYRVWDTTLYDLVFYGRDSACIGYTTVRWKVWDANGFVDSCDLTIGVYDNETPIDTFLQDTLYALTSDSSCYYIAGPELDPSYMFDNCGINTFWNDYNGGATVVGNSIPYGFDSITWYFQDYCGSTDTVVVYVNVVDSTPPEANCLGAALQVEINQSGSQQSIASEFDNSSTDNCGVVLREIARAEGPDSLNFNEHIIWSCDDVAVHDTFHSVILRVWDEDGNWDTCYVAAEVFDGFDPEVICQNANAYVDGDGVAYIDTADVVFDAYDNCGIGSITISQDTFFCGSLGPHNVVVTAYDMGGRFAECLATVFVQDTIGPVFNPGCPSDIMITLFDNCDTLVNWIEPQATDNCGDVSIVSNYVPPQTFYVGQYNVVYTATDGAGNVTQCSFTITIDDQEIPQVFCATPFTRALDLCGETVIPPGQIAISSDDCNIDSMLYSINDGPFIEYPGNTLILNCYHLGTNHIKVKAVDFAGNEAICTTEITIIDTIDPVVTCPDDVVVYTSHTVTGDCYADTAITIVFDYDYCSDQGGQNPGEYYDNDTCGLVIKAYIWNDSSGSFVAMEPMD